MPSYSEQPRFSRPARQAYYPPQPIYTGPSYTRPAGFGRPPYQQPVLAPVYQQPVWSQPVRKTSAGAVLGIIGVSVLVVVLIGLLVFFVASMGALAVSLSLVAALVPLAVVMGAVLWIDRWEPEPRLALFFALMWGAAAAVLMALVVGLGLEIASVLSTGQGVNGFIAAAIQAPLVEELAKGLGVLLIFFVARKHFDGPLDGLVYGAVIAAGFAFTENILYFAAAVVEGGISDFGMVFVVRAMMSPFAHVMFTALTGLTVGIAARRSGVGGVFGWFAIGLASAVALHSLWNGALFLVSSIEGFVLYYVLVQVPLFIGWILLTVFVRRHEIRITEARLSEYAAAGWFTPAEVRMLASWTGRRQARSWAASLPGDKRLVMRRFITDATRLAYTRQRIITGRNQLVHRRTERELLESVATDRAVLLGP
ncbi:PrsW family intramembrane metalloprotease [Okibacterium endophyticum]